MNFFFFTPVSTFQENSGTRLGLSDPSLGLGLDAPHGRLQQVVLCMRRGTVQANFKSPPIVLKLFKICLNLCPFSWKAPAASIPLSTAGITTKIRGIETAIPIPGEIQSKLCWNIYLIFQDYSTKRIKSSSHFFFSLIYPLSFIDDIDKLVGGNTFQTHQHILYLRGIPVKSSISFQIELSEINVV